MSVTAETFDGFHYTLKIGARTPRGTYPLVVAVRVDLPTERKAGQEETPDEKKKLDLEFQSQNKKLRDKLAQEQALATWVFELEQSRIEPLIHDRALFLQKPLLVSEQVPSEPTVSGPNPAQPTR
jgi:hypothetical protein